MNARQVIVRPVISEKSYALLAANKYTFRVHPDAHKTQIRQAVEQLFDVHVVAVNVLKVQAKPKRRGRFTGTRPGWKKAVVQLRAGEWLPVAHRHAGPAEVTGEHLGRREVRLGCRRDRQEHEQHRKDETAPLYPTAPDASP